ncbi:PAS domain-containing protein [Bradyrhizobium quebecense]|uniref:PAS domain-containing protein n=1 Tax=Bradyrhizobium quebecense TaxID=2748629 RepID=A0A973WU95_9BRAD|nr:PAS domain-containing protein [Bradyrhizobium quebecense]UGA46338.1 PAS domain-containing protein [Bradyrhizobium quebecense]
MHFESANSSVIKSIRQRDFLNTWLRLYARGQTIPRIDEFRPERIEEDLPDTVFFTVDAAVEPPQLTIESDGARMATAYGHSGKGRLLDDYLGPRLAPVVMPVYHECIARRLPAYTITDIDDIYGHVVAYERLLLPFSDGGAVTHLVASRR